MMRAALICRGGDVRVRDGCGREFGEFSRSSRSGLASQPPIVPPGETPWPLPHATGTFRSCDRVRRRACGRPPRTGRRQPDPEPVSRARDRAVLLPSPLADRSTALRSMSARWTATTRSRFPTASASRGPQLAAMATGGPAATGNQTSGASNGLFYFVFSPDEAVTSVTLGSTGNSLEVAGVSVSTIVPEPATWAMMLIGFTGLGYAAFRQSAKDRSAVKAI